MRVTTMPVLKITGDESDDEISRYDDEQQQEAPEMPLEVKRLDREHAESTGQPAEIAPAIQFAEEKRSEHD